MEVQQTAPSGLEGHKRERLLRTLALATFIIFFQAYMVAPIIPALSKVFGTSIETVGLIVPAYLIPYGISTLAYGVLADRIGIHHVMFASLAAFSVLTMLTATAQSIEQLAMWRLLTGIGASGVVPLALALVGRLYPYEQRGRPLGWLFGAMAGGMAFGSPLGAMIVPFVGWQGLFLVVGAAGAVLSLVLLPYRAVMANTALPVRGTLRDLFHGYRELLGTPRGQRTYGYVLVNSIFHSGVFTCRLLRAAIWHRVRRNRGGAPGLRCAGLPLWADHWPGCRPLGSCPIAPHRARAQRLLGSGSHRRISRTPRACRRDGPVAWLRHDPAALRRNRDIAWRQTGRTGDGLECLHAVRRLRPREPHLRRVASFRLRARAWSVRRR